MRIPKDHWLKTKPIAHRGLWGNSVVENSMTAYELAAKNNIPIEIDLYFTKDKHLVSFHDAALKRMTGADGKVWDYTLDELKQFRLLDTDETIPTFDEVLSIAENRSPLLIEIKKQPIDGIVEKILESLKGRNVEFAIQSFDPRYIIKLKKLDKTVIRGILSTTDAGEATKLEKFVVAKMPLNFLAKPDFVSIDFRDYPIKKSLSKKYATLAWTLTTQINYNKVKPFVDNVIYEGFELIK